MLPSDMQGKWPSVRPSVAYASLMASDNAARCCDLCGEPLSGPGYGSGALADGLYCSLTCYAMSSDRYIPPLADSTGPEGGIDDHET